jgi:glycosyltransferase involved in cell wall biosynthesis
MSQKTFFTIITVTYNAGSKVSKTIDSVYKQSCTDYEYILVDGASEDDTVQRIEKQQNQFSEKNISYRYLSERDSGVYDAMNKSISLANGEWVCFLNAGDLFYDSETLRKLKDTTQKNSSADIVYGDTIEFKANGLSIYRKALPIEQITQAIPFFHQSCITKLDLIKKNLFDIRYRICADYDFFLGCYQDNARFVYIELPVSRYEYGGISSCDDNAVLLLREQLEIRKNRVVFTKEDYNRELIQLERKSKIIGIKSMVKRVILLKGLLYVRDLKNGWSLERDKL